MSMSLQHASDPISTSEIHQTRHKSAKTSMTDHNHQHFHYHRDKLDEFQFNEYRGAHIIIIHPSRTEQNFSSSSIPGSTAVLLAEFIYRYEPLELEYPESGQRPVVGDEDAPRVECRVQA